MFTNLITPTQLAERLAAAPESTIICDCRFDLADALAGQRAFLEAHIPGAAWLSLETVLSGGKTGRNGRHPLPDREGLARNMAELGAFEPCQIIAYDAADAMFAARLWWLLRWIGHVGVAVLDGGFTAWMKAGHALESGSRSQRPAGVFQTRAPLVQTIDYDELREAKCCIIDARSPDRFAGQNEILDKQAGHIPGSRNRWFKQNVDAEGRFKPASILRDEFAALLDVAAPQSTVATCGSGVTACQTLLAMEVAGLPGATLYPGSWSEWSAQINAPVARGAA